MPVSRLEREDSIGWHYTKNGRYTVKSGYRLEQAYPDKGIQEIKYGPTITPLQARVWQLKCPPKIQHFIWQAISGCVAVAQNLTSRGIDCDLQCNKCGFDIETINHVLFECPPALQTWALSNVPTSPRTFPSESIFSNMDYLFSRIPPDNPDNYFPWIIWFLWKSRNDKVFKNRDKDPREVLRLAETEGKMWQTAQIEDDCILNTETMVSKTSFEMDHSRNGRWYCQVDGSWKDLDKYSGQGWVCQRNGEEGQLFGGRNIIPSLSPTHTEIETLVWAMKCMIKYHRFRIVFATDSQDVMKMTTTPEEWPAFAIHLEEYRRCKDFFEEIEIINIPRAQNIMADRIARSARRQALVVEHIGPAAPPWLGRTN